MALAMRHNTGCAASRGQLVCHQRCPPRTAALQCCASGSTPRSPPPAAHPNLPRQSPQRPVRCNGLVGGSDVVGTYTRQLTEEIHDLADEVKSLVPEKAPEILSEDEVETVRRYIKKTADLLLLEVDAEVQEFVACLKDWSLKWLQDDGLVLLGLSAKPAGQYYTQEAVRFFIPGGSKPGKQSKHSSFFGGSSDADGEWQQLPRHKFAPGDMLLLTPGKQGPLRGGGWCEDMLTGVVVERTKTSIKVAFDAAPDTYEMDEEEWRLDKSVNLLTIKRALLALLGLWHRKPWQQEAWLSRALRSILSSSCSSQEAAPLISADVRRFYDSLDGDGPRQHGGIFEGSALSGVILTADEAFDWSSLPAEAGGMTRSAINAMRQILPQGRPDEAATASWLKEMESAGHLGQAGRFLLDTSQMQAIATAILNPLALLHGPPGTGKTTTSAALLWFLRKQYSYNGRILATAQSNVAVDNMLETAMRLGQLRVLRIGEPAKVRSCLQAFTLKAQLAKALEADTEVMVARERQHEIRKTLRNARKARGEHMGGWERRQLYKELDKLRAEIDAVTRKLCAELLEQADVVGVTCTGAAGPELQHMAFDMVVLDEGSQASEPEALIPIMKGSQRVVIVGDHKQLPPVIKSKEAQEGGLDKSLFERLMHLGAPSAMLQVQYRSHPSLMQFINEEFYQGLLSNGVKAAARPTPRGFPFPSSSVPMVFVDVDGRESATARGGKINEKEAAVLESCLQLLIERCGLMPGQLGVITPYAAQVALLSKQLQARGFSINGSGRSSAGWDSEDDEFSITDLEVKSVDGYQGREKDVILLSTVRANSKQEVGFLQDWRRANVALSRARVALVVVGHKSTLRADKTWGAFLRHAAQERCLVKLEQLQDELGPAVVRQRRL